MFYHGKLLIISPVEHVIVTKYPDNNKKSYRSKKPVTVVFQIYESNLFRDIFLCSVIYVHSSDLEYHSTDNLQKCKTLVQIRYLSKIIQYNEIGGHK